MAIRVTVDVVIFTIRDGALHVLLVRRAAPPFAGRHAIPGGFVHEAESLEAAARRELAEETGVHDVYLEQLYTFGDPGRDPRGRVITVAYFALIASDETPLRAGTDAAEARWFPVARVPPLARMSQNYCPARALVACSMKLASCSITSSSTLRHSAYSPMPTF